MVVIIAIKKLGQIQFVSVLYYFYCLKLCKREMEKINRNRIQFLVS